MVKTCQGNTQTRTWRLVHLTEYHRCFGDNAGFLHLMVQVVSFTSTLTYTSEYGNTAVLLCDVVDQFLNHYGFTYTRTAEQTDLTTLCVRSKQVDDFNSCFQNFCLCGQVLRKQELHGESDTTFLRLQASMHRRSAHLVR